MEKESKKIIPGTTVKLNSGGPTMTVEKILVDESDLSRRILRCVWMDQTGQMLPQRGEFYETSVARVQGLK